MSVLDSVDGQARSPRHPIRVVTRRTGLSAAALRAWERRYCAVVPGRTDGGQRLYSDEDIQRLILLRRGVEGGRSIGQLAALGSEELAELVAEDVKQSMDQAASPGPVQETSFDVDDLGSGDAGSVLQDALSATSRLEPQELEAVLTRGALLLTPIILVEKVLVPLLRIMGERWARGESRPAVEHAASVGVRRFLDWLLSAQRKASLGPTIVVGTLSGQAHEFGALLAAVTAATEGWQVLVLGPDLPGEEIAEAARRRRADAVAVSNLLPGRAAGLLREITALTAVLPEGVVVLAGGPGSAEVSQELPAMGVRYLGSLAQLREALRLGSGGVWSGRTPPFSHP
jgi:MerR family transcriptional regulator, light-induced transcriptional regulator